MVLGFGRLINLLAPQADLTCIIIIINKDALVNGASLELAVGAPWHFNFEGDSRQVRFITRPTEACLLTKDRGHWHHDHVR